MEQDTQNPLRQTASEILSDSVKGKYNFFFHFSKPYTDAIDNGTFFQKQQERVACKITMIIAFSPEKMGDLNPFYHQNVPESLRNSENEQRNHSINNIWL